MYTFMYIYMNDESYTYSISIYTGVPNKVQWPVCVSLVPVVSCVNLDHVTCLWQKYDQTSADDLIDNEIHSENIEHEAAAQRHALTNMFSCYFTCV